MAFEAFGAAAMRDKRLDNRATSQPEMLLIRVGHHLWRSYKRKEYPKSVALRALQDVWDRKEALRVILRKEWLEFYENRKKRGFQKRAEP